MGGILVVLIAATAVAVIGALVLVALAFAIAVHGASLSLIVLVLAATEVMVYFAGRTLRVIVVGSGASAPPRGEHSIGMDDQ